MPPPPEIPDPLPGFAPVLADECPPRGARPEPAAEPRVIQLSAGEAPVVATGADFPVSARDRCISGWTAFAFEIGPDGHFRALRVIGAHPPEVFRAASLVALGSWKYRPKRPEEQESGRGGCALFLFDHPLRPLDSAGVEAWFPAHCPYPGR